PADGRRVPARAAAGRRPQPRGETPRLPDRGRRTGPGDWLQLRRHPDAARPGRGQDPGQEESRLQRRFRTSAWHLPGRPQAMTPLALALLLAPTLPAADPPAADAPRPIPLTRPEMKKYLEDMKLRTPRIPLPELTAAEKARLGERGA